MDKSTLGEIIRFYRKKQKVSQRDLCRKICSVPTMSRIESGEIETPMMMAQALLGRLGVNVNKFELLVDENDYHLYRQRSKVEKALQKENVFQAEKELLKYETMMEKDKLNRQYVKFQKVKIILLKIQNVDKAQELSSEMEYMKEEAEQLLLEAEELTIPKSDEKGEILLSRMEIAILLTKVRKYHMENLKRVHDYIKKNYSMELKEEIYPMVQLELAKLQAEAGDKKQALLEIEEGLEMLARGRSYRYCAELHFLYARILEKLNSDKENWEEVREECITRCQQAYYLYEFDEDERKREVEKYLREVLRWEFTF